MFNLKYTEDNKEYLVCPFVQSHYITKNIKNKVNQLKNVCESIIKDKFSKDNRSSLLGEIKKGSQLDIGNLNNEYIIDLKKDIMDAASIYIKLYQYKLQNYSIELDAIWIVNQLATDYNPIHIHENSKSDYGLSGFIHINLPETINKVKNMENLCDVNSRGAKGCHDGVTSLIWKGQGTKIHKKSFQYPGIIECPLETGLIYIFPSWLDHTVYPFFNTDESRITIAYNISVVWK